MGNSEKIRGLELPRRGRRCVWGETLSIQDQFGSDELSLKMGVRMGKWVLRAVDPLGSYGQKQSKTLCN